MLYGVQDLARDMLGVSTHSEKLRKDEFWAVRDVTFELKRGDTLGIVGANGAGKTTLLKMLNGIVRPDKGHIKLSGRVGALIEVGAGFHPMLTGRENVYVNGAILGMSKREIDRKFDSIVDFSELEDFLDVPVRNYSSGMYVRLGFAVAAHSEPEVLLVDEILAVGDIAFQKKCFRYIEESILGKGVTLCLVSHSIYTIARMCSQAILMNHGIVEYYGDASGVVPEYYGLMHSRSKRRPTLEDSDGYQRPGAGEVRITGVEMKSKSGDGPDLVRTGDGVEFIFSLHAEREMQMVPQASLKISDQSGTIIAFAKIPEQERNRMRLRKGSNALSCTFYSLNLMPGHYVLGIKLGGVGDLVQDALSNAMQFEVVAEPKVHESTAAVGLVYVENHWTCS